MRPEQQAAGNIPGDPARSHDRRHDFAGLSGGEDIAEAIAGYWRAVGVDVNLQNIDGVELTTRLRNLAIPNGMTLRLFCWRVAWVCVEWCRGSVARHDQERRCERVLMAGFQQT